jgi:hypothetical protein
MTAAEQYGEREGLDRVRICARHWSTSGTCSTGLQKKIERLSRA